MKIETWTFLKTQFSNLKFHNLGLGSFFAVGAVLEFEYMKRKKEVKKKFILFTLSGFWLEFKKKLLCT